MRLLFLMGVLLSSVVAEAAMEMPRWSVRGFYGNAFINPSDVNSSSQTAGTTPRVNNIVSDVFYGGDLGYMISPKWDFRIIYDSHDAKNPTNLSSPAVSGAGFELIQNDLWAQIDYYFFHAGPLMIYLGGGVGYPLYAHATLTLSSKTDYDADKAFLYMGNLGFCLMFGMHFSLFAEGGYQFMALNNLKTSAGVVLTNSTGANSKMDLSGLRALAGINLMF